MRRLAERPSNVTFFLRSLVYEGLGLGMTGRLAILGGGKIGEALLSGLLRGGTLRVDDIVVVEKHEPRAAELRDKYGVATVDVAKAAVHADTILIAVKPQDIGALLAELDDHGRSRHTVVLRRGRYHNRRASRRAASDVAVVRCMPNTPALVDQAITAISPGQHADDDHLAVAERLLSAVGRVVRVPEIAARRGNCAVRFRSRVLLLLVEAMIDARDPARVTPCLGSRADRANRDRFVDHAA